MYIVFYSVTEPQHALLAINTLQKALTEPDYLVRLFALKTMTSIAVKDISQVSLLALIKGVKDLSPRVRCTAALALPKLFNLDPRLEEEVLSLLEALLRDDSEIVLGAAFHTFSELCPTQWELIHPSFRIACASLQAMDEWAQITVIKTLTRYASEFFIDPKGQGKDNEEGEGEDFGDDEYEVELEADHRLLLSSVSPLLLSINTAVSFQAALLLYYVGEKKDLPLVAKTLLRLLHTNIETQFYVLDAISTMAIDHPELFHESITEFFVRTYDSKRVRFTKLEVLTRIASEDNISSLLREIKEYTKDPEIDFVAKAIQTIGKCAMIVPEVASVCQRFLLAQMASESQEIVAESVVVLKQLLQLENKQQTTTLEKIAQVEAKIREHEQSEENKDEEQLKEDKGIIQENEPNNEENEEEENNTENKNDEHKEEEEEAEVEVEDAEKKEEEGEEEEENEKKEEVVVVNAVRPDGGAPVAESPAQRRRIIRRTTPFKKELEDLQYELSESHKRVSGVVRRLYHLINEITNPLARSSILFVIGEYAPKNETTAPEVLRIVANSFKEEEDIVKLEALSLASRLQLSPEAREGPHGAAIEKLCQYLFSLAKYDLSFDIRDRARFLKALVFPTDASLAEHCKDIFFVVKPVPQVHTGNVANRFCQGTLSHLIAEPVANYMPLPSFNEEVPPASIRDPIIREAPATPSTTVFSAPTTAEEEEDDSALFGEVDEEDGWEVKDEWGAEEGDEDDLFGTTDANVIEGEEEEEWGGYEEK
jgi:HEAT repeat protein